jgi:hypothetical protein
MKRLAGSVARMLHCAVSSQLKKYRRRALEAELSHCFQRLEPRRVLTVNGVFDAVTGVLNVEISAGGNTTAVLRDQAGDDASFFLDENNNGIFNPGVEVGGLKADLRQLLVNGVGGVDIGTFQWLDLSLLGSPMRYNLQSLSIDGVQSVVLETRATIANASTIEASDAITFGSIASGNQLIFQNNLILEATGPAGQIISTANAQLRVDGLLDVRAATIDLGNQAGDNMQFGSLHFESNGSVAISEDSDMLIVDVGLNANSADTLNLSADGDLSLTSNSRLNVTDSVTLSGDSILMQQGSQIDASGDIQLQATAGHVVVTRVDSESDVAIQAAGNILDGDAGVDDLDVRGVNVTLTATNGSIGSSTADIFVADTAAGNPNPLEVEASTSYTATANNGMIALDAAGTATITANTDTLWIQSNGSVVVASLPAALLAGKSNLALMADINNNGTGTLILPNALTVVGDLRLRGTDVTAADGTIDLGANRLMFFSDQTETLTATATHIDAETLGSLFLTTTASASLTDLNNNTYAARAVGDLVVVTSTGTLTVNGIVQSNTGDVLLRTDAASGDIDIQAAVMAPAGHVTIQASDDIRLDARVTAGGAGTVYLLANNSVVNGGGVDGVIMTSGSQVATAGANILIEARNDGDARLGLVDAGAGDVSILAQGSILDGNAWSLVSSNATAGQNQITLADATGFAVGDLVSIHDNNSVGNVFAILAITGNVITLSGNLTSAFETAQSAHVTAINIRANRLSMVADSNNNNLGAIGSEDVANGVPDRNRFAIDTQVAILAVQSGQGIYVREVDGVAISPIAANASFVQQVNANGTLTAVGNAGLSGLVTNLNPVGAAPIKLQSVSGDLVINEPITAVGAGDVLLQTLTSGNITLASAISSGSGNISIRSSDSISQSTSISTTGGDVLVAATNNVTMAAASQILSAGGNVVMTATNGTLLLGLVNAGAGDVSLTAGVSILDNNAASLNVIADALRMVATSGRIGDADPINGIPNNNDNAIDTQVSLLAARSALGIYVREVNGLTIGNTGTITAERVHFNSTTSDFTEATLEDLTTTNNGAIKLLSVNGNIVVNAGPNGNPGISAHGIGDVLLQTLTAGSITVSGAITSGNGNVSLRSVNSITQSANISTLGGDVVAAAASNLTMAAATQIGSAGGNVLLSATTGSILLGLINAGSGDVSLTAGVSILDNNAGSLNVISEALRMVATGGRIGNSDAGNGTPNANINAIDTQVNTLAARSALGIYVREIDGVTIDNTGNISGDRVNFNSTTTLVTDLSLEDLTTTSNGPIKLQSINGDIVVNAGSLGNPGISANGTGDVLLQTLTSGTISVNALVQSGTGDISIKSADDLSLTNNYSTSGAGTLYFTSGGDITWAAGVDTLNTNGAHVRLVAGRDIQLRQIDANGTGDVGLSAGRDILDANDGIVINTRNVFARNLVMLADSDGNGTGIIGGSDVGNLDADANRNAIDTQVSFLAARSATGIYVRELDGVTVGTTTVDVRQVNFNSTDPSASVSLEDLTTTSNGPIKLQSINGDIVVNAGSLGNPGISANGSGDVLLQTLTSGTIVVNALVQSGTGDISIKSADDLSLTNNYSTSGAGTLYFTSGGDITWAAGVDTLNTNGAHVRLVAGRDIQLRQIDANGTGDVGLSAGRDILDANDGIVINTRNVFARTLVMLADSDGNGTGIIGGSDVGNPDPDANRNAIDTQVSFLAARSATGIYVRELDGVTVGTTTVDVRQVNFNSTDPSASVSLEDLTTTSNGPIKLQSINGDIVVNAGSLGNPGISANGTGDVLLQTLIAGDIEVNGDVRSDSGRIGIRAAGDLMQNADISTGGGAIFVDAGLDLTMNSSAQSISGGGTVQLGAGGSILLGLINAGSGDVSLTAGVSILDNNAGSLNVISEALRMVATGGRIGNSDAGNGTPNANINAIDTQVNTLAARSALGIYVREIDGVTIDDTGNISGDRVNFNSTTTLVTDLSLEDLTTTSNGPIKLQSINGDIVVNAGSLGNPGISANGSGDVLLQTLTSGTIVVNALVQSGTGDISIKSADDLSLTNNYSTSGAGTLYFTSGGDITWAAGVDTLNTNGAHVRLVAGRDIQLRQIDANGTGDVGLSAGRDILDANDGIVINTRNVFARNLVMLADSDGNGTGIIGGSDVGNLDADANRNAIDTQVSFLAARSATGIYVRELDGVTVGTTTVDVRQVNFNSTDPSASVSLEDLTTTSNGPIKLQSINGDIVVNAGSLGNPGISANGTGDVLLQTLIAGDIEVNGDVRSGTGHISIRSSASVVMASTTSITTGNGDVLVIAGNQGDIYLSQVQTNAGDVALWAEGSILDNNDGVSNVLNVAANRLSMVADSDGNGVGFIGVWNQDRNGLDADISSIDTSVNELAARAAQGIFVREVNGVTIVMLSSITVQQVDFRSTTTDVAAAGVDGLNAAGPIKLLVDAGDLQLDRPVVAWDGANRFDVSLKSFGGWIDEGATDVRVVGDYLTLYARLHAHLHDTSVNTLRAEVFENATLSDAWQIVNTAASDRGDDFVDQLTTLDEAAKESVRNNFRFQSLYETPGYALYLVNDRALVVASIAAGNSVMPGDSPNVYVETTGVSNLTINGTVQTWSNDTEEGGIVLVAGTKLDIAAGGSLVTATSQGFEYNQIINDEDLRARFFNADPVPSGVNGRYTTKTVTFTPDGNPVTETTHVYQQVAIQFGSGGERGFWSIIGYADGVSQTFRIAGEEGPAFFNNSNLKPIDAFPQVPSIEAALFTRQTQFDTTFLYNHPVLPTDAVIRRSADFFLFENASQAEAGGIRDLTVATQPIVVVISNGDSPAPSPPNDPVRDVPVFAVPPAPVELIDQPLQIDLPQVELTSLIEKKAEVFLYHVSYDDLDEDGQPDANELPADRKVLDELDDENRISFPGENESTKPSSAQPTQAEIERIKEALAQDPEAEVGVYSIIKKSADGKSVVLETFPIRDSEEATEDVQESIRIVDPGSSKEPDGNAPAPKPEDGAFFIPSNWKRNSALALDLDPVTDRDGVESGASRFTSLGLAMGSVWVSQIKRQRTSLDAAPATNTSRDPQPDHSEVGFSSQERRRRRMQRQVQQWVRCQDSLQHPSHSHPIQPTRTEAIPGESHEQ